MPLILLVSAVTFSKFRWQRGTLERDLGQQGLILKEVRAQGRCGPEPRQNVGASLQPFNLPEATVSTQELWTPDRSESPC